jgi:hypothetical protein
MERIVSDAVPTPESLGSCYRLIRTQLFRICEVLYENGKRILPLKCYDLHKHCRSARAIEHMGVVLLMVWGPLRV